MNESLERRYRRLLRLYPKTFRRAHEEEILTLLMAGATKTQTRPHLIETLNLVIHASLWRIRHLNVPQNWEYRYAAVMLPMRVAGGITLLFLTAILYGYGRAGWWTPVLLPAAYAHFYVAHRLSQQSTRQQPSPRDCSPRT